MPELPDLQVFSHNLNKRLKGKTVTDVVVRVDKKLNVAAATLKKHLADQSIKKIYREGKELYIVFSNDDILALHLMLHGNMYLFEGENTNKHTIIELWFDDNTGLTLTDWQNAATPTLNPEVRPSPDALDKAVNVEFLKEKLQSRAAIKNLLLDQDVIRGIGNAYADEILWDARISPFAISNKIPDARIKALVASIHNVLTHAEEAIRKANPDIITGEVRDFLVIHNAKKKESPTGAEIKIKKSGSRKTYYTDEQEEFS